jgi:hypothetical protein
LEDNSLLVVYELTENFGLRWNHLKIRYYKSFEDLEKNKFSAEKDLPRVFKQDNEGTPSFSSVTIKNGDLRTSSIKMRFHYFRDNTLDQQAYGILTNWD